MDCREIKEQASAFYHHELEEMFQKAISDHLLFCPSCQKEYENFRFILDKLKSTQHEGTPLSPRYFETLVQKAVTDPEIPRALIESWRGKPASFGWRKHLLRVAALFFVVISLNYLYNREIFTHPSPHDVPVVSSDHEYLRYLALIDPDDPQGNVKLAIWCKEQKLISEAREHLQRALDLEPHNPKMQALKDEFKM